MIETIKEVSQLGGTVVTVVSFLYYMLKQNQEFNKTIQNHLDHSNRVIDKNSDAMIQITATLQDLCTTLKKTNRGMRGLRGLQGKQGEKGERGR